MRSWTDFICGLSIGICIAVIAFSIMALRIRIWP
jgi:hypothetical protein